MRSIFLGFVRSGAAVTSLLLAATLAFAQAGGGAGGGAGGSGGAAGAGGATGAAGAASGASGAGSGVTTPNVGGATPGSVVPGTVAPGTPGVQAPGVGGNTVAPGVQAPGFGGTIAPSTPTPGLTGPSLNPSLPNSGPVTPGATSPASGNVSTPNSPAAPAGSAGGTGSGSTGVGSRALPGTGTANPNATTLPGGTAVPGSTPGTTGAANRANPVNRGQLGFSVRSGAGDGLVVSNVNSGGLAQQAGLLPGDQIVSINGNAVNSQADISTALRTAATAGNNVRIGVRRSGQLQSINVNAGSGTGALGQAGSTGSTSAGLTPTTSPTAQQVTTGFRGFADGLTFTPALSGLSISGISDGSWATLAGFQVGDQIVSVDGQPVASQTQFPTQLQGAVDRAGFANVIVNRNGQTVPLRVTLPSGVAGLSTGQAGATGDFNTLAGDFSTAFTAANTNLQTQMTQLNSLGRRIDALRTALANPPTDAAGQARVFDQLRTLRAELNALNAQSNMQFFQQLEALRTRLNDFNPTFNQATTATGSATGSATGAATGSAGGAAGTATGSGAAQGGSAIGTGAATGSGSGSASGSSSSSSSTAPGASSSPIIPSTVRPADRTVIGGRSSDGGASGVTVPPTP